GGCLLNCPLGLGAANSRKPAWVGRSSLRVDAEVLAQPSNAAAGRRGLFLHTPFEPAEERRSLRPCAQRTSWTDSAQLSDRSVAEGVLRGASRIEHRREPHSEATGRAVRGRLFAYFLVAQKVGRPPGRIPGWVSRVKPPVPTQAATRPRYD